MATRATARVVLRFDNINSFRDEELASWLRDEDELYGTKNVQELTLEVVFDSWGLQTPELEETFDALTPSIAGKVVCPRLTTFSIRRRYEQAVDATETSPFDFVSLPHGRPTYREDWEGMINASRLVQVEEERRAISAGSSAEEDKCNSTITDSALVCSSPPSKKVKLLNGADSSAASEVDSAVSPECAALDRITLEACYVDDAAWAAIKTSQSQYSVAPDPDEMKKLAYEGPDRKTKNFGERKMRRDEDQ